MLIVIDTNVLLHCLPLHEIDWLSHFEIDRIELVLCSTVLGELDEKKNDPRVSERAKSADRALRKYEENNDHVAVGVSIRFEESDDSKGNNNDAKILNCARKIAESEDSLPISCINSG